MWLGLGVQRGRDGDVHVHSQVLCGRAWLRGRAGAVRRPRAARLPAGAHCPHEWRGPRDPRVRKHPPFSSDSLGSPRLERATHIRAPNRPHHTCIRGLARLCPATVHDALTAAAPCACRGMGCPPFLVLERGVPCLEWARHRRDWAAHMALLRAIANLLNPLHASGRVHRDINPKSLIHMPHTSGSRRCSPSARLCKHGPRAITNASSVVQSGAFCTPISPPPSASVRSRSSRRRTPRQRSLWRWRRRSPCTRSPRRTSGPQG